VLIRLGHWDASAGLEEVFNLMEHKIDRISELPDPILEHILSFIPTKQTLQLSILSKRWQRVWALFPVPDFGQHLFVNNLRKAFIHKIYSSLWNDGGHQ
jgi:hypothetical protein